MELGIGTENLNDDNQSRKLPQVSVPSVEMCDFPKLFGYCQLLCYLFHRTVHRIKDQIH